MTKGVQLNLPRALVIEEAIRALLILLSDVLRFLVSLEPGLILLMKSPTLALEGLRRQVLLVSALSIVERVEQAVGIYSAIQSRIVEYPQRLLWVVCWRVVVWILRLVVIRLLRILRCGTSQARSIQQCHVEWLI